MAQRTVTIASSVGLHARPAAPLRRAVNETGLGSRSVARVTTPSTPPASWASWHSAPSTAKRSS